MKKGNIRFVFFGIALLSAASFSGCSGIFGGEDSDESGNAPGGCGMAESGTGGEVVVTPGGPVTLDEINTDTQNIDMRGQLASGMLGTLRYGPCGAAGLLLWIGEGSETELVFTDPTTSGDLEVVDPEGGARDASLFFDADCTPLVVRSSVSKGVIEYTRDDSGAWTGATVLDDFETVLGDAPSSLTQVASNVGKDGKLYVFIRAMLGDEAVLVRGEREAAATAAWSFVEMPEPEATELHGYWVDGSGNTHTLFRNTPYPCDPCNVDFYHGTYSIGDTAWTTEVVQAGKWGDPLDEFIEEATLVFDSAGNPFIAAHFGRHVITGSYNSAELRLYGMVDGTWCGEIIASETDGYAGTDGTNCTGADPQIVIDGNDRIHIIFQDQSLWHVDGMENQIRGQLRYAVRSGAKWYKSILLEQPGQTESTNPLVGLSASLLAVSPGGAEIVAATVAQSWQTDSTYNDESVPATYRAQSVTATVAPAK